MSKRDEIYHRRVVELPAWLWGLIDVESAAAEVNGSPSEFLEYVITEWFALHGSSAGDVVQGRCVAASSFTPEERATIRAVAGGQPDGRSA